MYRVRASWLARRYGLGRVIDFVALRPSLAQVVVFWSPLILVVPVVLMHAATGYGFNWEALAVAVIGCPLMWLVVQSDKVAICEGGLLMGGFGPFLRPFRIRWSQVDPATIVFLTSYQRLHDTVAPGQHGLQQTSSARRGPAHGSTALCLAGPRIRAAATGRLVMNELVNTVHGGHLWSAGIGSRRVERTRRALLTAWAPLLGPDIRRLERQLAGTIRLDEDPVVAAAQIPGFIAPWDRRPRPVGGGPGGSGPGPVPGQVAGRA